MPHTPGDRVDQEEEHRRWYGWAASSWNRLSAPTGEPTTSEADPSIHPRERLLTPPSPLKMAELIGGILGARPGSR